MKKSLKKQAVFPVLMLLVVTALALIGSSFAWFSMNSVAKVTQVSGQVEDSSVGLMISQDAANFTGQITLNESAATYVKPARFHQLSTTNATTFYEAVITQKNPNGTAAMIYTTTYAKMPKAGTATGTLAGYYNDGSDHNLDSGAISYTDTSVEPNKTYNNEVGYMVFDLFFSVEYASTLYLNKDTKFSQTGSAFRVAFLYYGYVATESATAAAAKALSSLGSTLIWDPANNTSYNGITTAHGTDLASSFAPYADNEYADPVTTRTSAQLFDSTNSWSDTNLPATSGEGQIYPVATLGAGVNKVRVVVWLEGNDPSCTSAVANTNMTLDLSFWAKKN